MRRNAFCLLNLVVLASLIAIPLARAGTSGDLNGRVTGEKREPLAGVNIRIEGLRLGAISDDQGVFRIIGIPAGEYVVKANLLGYAAYAADKVAITPDFATKLDIVLKTEAVPMEEVRVEAERPLLQKDATGTTRFISATDIQKLPTRGYRDAAAQQTGIVNFQRQIDNETQNNPTLIIRGGRPNETAYYVDGFSQQDPLSGTSSTSISNHAIQEVVVLTGGFAPEYGRIMSGAVNVVTKEGGGKYFGSLEAVTDALAGEWVGAPVTDYNIYEASVGGPVMPSNDNLTFYLSGGRRWQRDRAPTFMPSAFRSELERTGLDPDFKPNNSSGGYTLQGKLSWQFNDRMTLKAGGLGSEDEWQEYQHAYLNNLAHTPRYYDKNQSYFATFHHVLNPRSYWNAGFNYFETLRKRGDGVAFDNLSEYLIASNPRFDPDVPMFFSPGHVVENYLQRHSAYWGVQASHTMQTTLRNQLKYGGDFQRHTLRYYQAFRPTRSSSIRRDWDGYGYDLKITPVPGASSRVELVENDDNSQDGPKHPIIWSAFLQDKYEREGVIVNGGLRFDYINVDTPTLANASAPLAEQPFPDSLDAHDLTTNRTYARLSPRLGVAFPLDDKTILRFNYGQFYQQPNLQDLYVSYRFLEYKLQTGGYYVGLGNPNLRPEHTTAYEVGVARQIGDRVRIDATAYYKDVEDLVEVQNIASIPPSQSKSFSSFRNADFATVKGVDIGFTMRQMNHISAGVNYSLSYAQGTGSVSNTQRNIAWTASETPKQTAPLDFDQRHKLSANLDLSLRKGEGPVFGGFRPFEKFGLNVLLNIASGTPYTPTNPFNELTLAAVASQPAGPINSRYGPWTETLDLKATRAFDAVRLRIEAYIWVLNLFDAENAYTVYTSTGSPLTTGFLNSNDGRAYVENADNQGKDGVGQYRLAEGDPTLFGTPRIVRFGLRANF